MRVHDFGRYHKMKLTEYNEKNTNSPPSIKLLTQEMKADALKLSYDYIASWITLTIHSSLDAVGLTAVFSTELSKHRVPLLLAWFCN